MNYLDDVRRWFDAGADDFDRGFALLSGVSRNRFHLDNVRRRRDLASVRHELNKLYYSLGGKVKLEIKRVALPVAKQGAGVSGAGALRAVGKPVKVVAEKTGQTKGRIQDKRTGAVTGEGGVVTAGTGALKGEGGAVSRDTGAVAEAGELQVKVVDRDGFVVGRIVKSVPRDERVVLRNEFPFLAEPGCPEEFKILVADMITAHSRYMKGHDRLFEVANKDNETCFAAARETVENYIDNREMWEELEYYKKTGEILGVHRVFTDRKMREKIVAMGEDELEKFVVNINRRRLYREKMIAEDGNNERVFDWKKEIEELDRMKLLVKSWGVNARTRKRRGKKKK